jgi:hypothetical protein
VDVAAKGVGFAVVGVLFIEFGTADAHVPVLLRIGLSVGLVARLIVAVAVLPLHVGRGELLLLCEVVGLDWRTIGLELAQGDASAFVGLEGIWLVLVEFLGTLPVWRLVLVKELLSLGRVLLADQLDLLVQLCVLGSEEVAAVVVELRVGLAWGRLGSGLQRGDRGFGLDGRGGWSLELD